jgi:hypothetical protein
MILHIDVIQESVLGVVGHGAAEIVRTQCPLLELHREEMTVRNRHVSSVKHIRCVHIHILDASRVPAHIGVVMEA